MTKQEIFNIVWRGLESQGWRHSVNAAGECRYRGPDNCRCAVGWLIPDEDYSPNMEGLSAYTSSLIRILERRGYDENLNFIARMQSAHDNTYHLGRKTPKELRDIFVHLAESEGLTIPE